MQKAGNFDKSKGAFAIAALIATMMGCEGAADETAPIGAEEEVAVDAPATTATPAAQEGAAWPPAECDDVYEIRAHAPGNPSAPYTVPAGAEIHPQIPVNPPWGTQRVQAIATKPINDNKKVVHHWIMYNGIAFLSSWAPGDNDPVNLPEGVGLELPTTPGSIRLDMHYFNKTGRTAETDRSGLELCVVRGAKLRKNIAAVHMGFSVIAGLSIPPGRKNHDVTSSCRVTATQPVYLLTAGPHAHKLAKHMKFTVRKANGQQVVMHDGPFQFGEEGTYFLNPPLQLQTGDTVTTTCTFDNDTTRTVRFGDSTEDEMCFNFAMYYPKGGLRCGLGI